MVCVGGLVKNGVVFLTKGTPDMRANSVGQQSGDLQKKTKKNRIVAVLYRGVS